MLLPARVQRLCLPSFSFTALQLFPLRFSAFSLGLTTAGGREFPQERPQFYLGLWGGRDRVCGNRERNRGDARPGGARAQPPSALPAPVPSCFPPVFPLPVPSGRRAPPPLAPGGAPCRHRRPSPAAAALAAPPLCSPSLAPSFPPPAALALPRLSSSPPPAPARRPSRTGCRGGRPWLLPASG